MYKLISVLILSALLSGCGMMAGNYSKTVATNPQTGEVQKTRWGGVVYNVVREARSVAIMRGDEGQTVAAKPNPCGDPLSGEVLEKIGSNAAAEYFRSRGDCMQLALMGSVVAYATGRPTTAAGEIAREKQVAVHHSEQGLTDRFNAVARPLGTIGLSVQARKAVESGNDALRDVGVAAAENSGDISIGNIAMGDTQTASTSNDSTTGEASGSSGELGSATASSGAGTSDGDATNTTGGNTYNLNIGKGNSMGVAQDNANLISDSDHAQNVATSASGTVLDGDVNSLQNGEVIEDAPDQVTDTTDVGLIQ